MEHFIDNQPGDRDPYARRRRDWRAWAIYAAGTAAIIGLGYAVFECRAAWAHDALPTAANPTGWTYGWECCSAMDCEQVQQSSIGETPKGYLIRRTGEVIGYDDKRIKRSKDEFYHRCTPGGNEDAKRSICLYVPDRSW